VSLTWVDFIHDKNEVFFFSSYNSPSAGIDPGESGALLLGDVGLNSRYARED
jgi:hypothetical protein